MSLQEIPSRISFSIASGKRNDINSRRYDGQFGRGPVMQGSPFRSELQVLISGTDARRNQRLGSLSPISSGRSSSSTRSSTSPKGLQTSKPPRQSSTVGSAPVQVQKRPSNSSDMGSEPIVEVPLSSKSSRSGPATQPSRRVAIDNVTHPLLQLMFDSVSSSTEVDSPSTKLSGVSTAPSNPNTTRNSVTAFIPPASEPQPRVQLPRVIVPSDSLFHSARHFLDSPTESSQMAPHSPIRNEICRNYLKGCCHWGPRCYRHHPVLSSSFDRSRVSLGATVKSVPESSFSIKATSAICLDWLQGFCSRGDSCPNIHIAAEDSAQLPLTESSGNAGDHVLVRAVASPRTSLDVEVATVVGDGFELNPCLTGNDPTVQLPKIDDVHEKVHACQSSDLVSKIASLPRASQNAKSASSTKEISPIKRVEQIVLASTNIVVTDGFVIDDIITGFESRSVIIGNLDLSTSRDEIRKLVSPFGEVTKIGLPHQAKHGVTVTYIEFLRVQDAMKAAESLHSIRVNERRIFARLKITCLEGAAGVGKLQTCSVKVSWPVPSMSVYARYSTFEDACEALESLDGQILNGRKVSVSHHLGDARRSDGFTLRFDGCEPDTPMSDLCTFCRSEYVALGPHNYRSTEESLVKARRVLEDIGPLTKFSVCASSPADKGIKVWIDFASSDDTATACETLHAKRQPFLGNNSLWFNASHTITYDIDTSIYEATRDDIKNAVSNRHDSSYAISFQVFESNRGDASKKRIVLRGENLLQLSRCKTKLEVILAGNVLLDEGLPLWDEYFRQDSAVDFLEKVRLDSQAIVHRDLRKSTLYSFGSTAAQRRALELIRNELAAVRARTHYLKIADHHLQSILRTGVRALQQRFGAANVRVDLSEKRLILRGDGPLQAAKLMLHNAEQKSKPRSTPISPRSQCPICIDQPVDPVLLECGHLYCKECIRHYLLSVCDSGPFPLCCIASNRGCKQLITLSMANAVLSAPEQTLLINAAFRSHIRTHPNEFRYCPTPDCPQIYRTNQENKLPVQCPSCLVRICQRCHVEYHFGMSCAERRDGGKQLYDDWKRNNDVQTCPGCQTDIERTEGCNHMTCVRCQTHICWLCLETFSEGKAVYEHIELSHSVHAAALDT
ncbi:hypothetical protein SISNIDRAFT_454812 [Sistotremastrum niveocremeum HHB9708]|uniref:Uncharacterized protein n=1 Tax=Sistotremastrum niveocremeum HHB9708 TaxID=1314777 RepID=A0A164U3F5_9AGAM|nr:hypothetical protein SISNIDRAFT_454812 [Sistotremastrum niveocremeum HHB9708]